MECFKEYSESQILILINKKKISIHFKKFERGQYKSIRKQNKLIKIKGEIYYLGNRKTIEKYKSWLFGGKK